MILTAALTFTPTTVGGGCPPIVARWCPPPPPPLPVPFPAGVERWRPIVEHFWDEPHTSRMLRIMRCESGGDPRAYNGRTGVKGLFQVHPLWQKPWPGDYYDPWTNAAVAYQVWLEQGYRAWSCKA